MEHSIAAQSATVNITGGAANNQLDINDWTDKGTTGDGTALYKTQTTMNKKIQNYYSSGSFFLQLLLELSHAPSEIMEMQLLTIPKLQHYQLVLVVSATILQRIL